MHLTSIHVGGSWNAIQHEVKHDLIWQVEMTQSTLNIRLFITIISFELSPGRIELK